MQHFAVLRECQKNIRSPFARFATPAENAEVVENTDGFGDDVYVYNISKYKAQQTYKGHLPSCLSYRVVV